MVATGNCSVTSYGIIPKPIGGTYLKHIANIIVHIKPTFWSQTNGNIVSPYAAFRATMIKHPYQKTPKSVNFYARKIGKRRNPAIYVMD
jgi:hypothetical protein